MSTKPVSIAKIKKGIKGVAERDRWQTPPYALDPLYQYISKEWTIWEPAAGEGYLYRSFINHGFKCIKTDIITGQDFLKEDPPPNVDVIVTNPPYSIKYKWLRRCYELGLPYALLMPVDVIGASKAQSLFKKHGVQILYLDKRVFYKSPTSGWNNNGAYYSSCWYTWGIMVKEINWGIIHRRPAEQIRLFSSR